MKNQETHLRNALKVNAIFSFVTSISLLLFSKKIAALMDIPHAYILLMVGGGLLLFCGLLIYTAYQKEISANLVKAIIIQDWIWVGTSGIILILDLFSLSDIGKIGIAVVAAIVAQLAISQAKGLSKLKL